MDISAPASLSPVPRHTADLRPAADAASLARNPRPSLPLGVAAASQPPQPTQVAAISRAMLDTAGTAEFPPVREPERLLKPYGIQMLPHRADEDRERTGDPDEARDAARPGAPSEAPAPTGSDRAQRAQAKSPALAVSAV